MKTWAEQINTRISLVQNQIMAAQEIQKMTGMDAKDICRPYWTLLEKLYNDELPFANLLDASDIVLHAEGEAVSDTNPTLHAVNWLHNTAEKQLRNLAHATLHLSEDSKAINNLDLRLTGIAHGGFYAGFKIQEPEKNRLMKDFDDPVFELIRNSVTDFPEITRFIGKNSLKPDVKQMFPDAAIRDAMLTTAFNLSPTGKMGIDTIEFSAPSKHRKATKLSKNDHIAIREILKRPLVGSKKSGSFVGKIREMDLDFNRFHLREVNQIGELRCICQENYSPMEFKKLFDTTVKIKGEYEMDEFGKPRLMIVSSIDVINRDLLLH